MDTVGETSGIPLQMDASPAKILRVDLWDIATSLLHSLMRSGSVSANHTAGGLVGINSGTVRYTYSTGSVVGRHNAGGLAGISQNSIAASYATGNVSASVSDEGSVEVSAGGFVGHNSGNIASAYATGRVVGSASADEEWAELRVKVGGFVGPQRRR